MYVPYTTDIERFSLGEDEVIDKVIKVTSKGENGVREREGHALRISHVKAHGLAPGDLTVPTDLAPEFRQGLFAAPGTFWAIVPPSASPVVPL